MSSIGRGIVEKVARNLDDSMANLPTTARRLIQDLEDIVLPELSWLFDEWAPDDPPVTTALSAIGRVLIESDLVRDEHAEVVLTRAEFVLEHGTDSEKDAVATGLLEALVTTAERCPQHAHRLHWMGPRSKRYVADWNSHLGI